ncbi:4599_t:CDS:10 [Funneliformis geosporum]|uniref:FACT complex subunit POB3 n=1 Tax=Funneliformis geosporum TaxID=1117311 RepID=A0A9W4SXN2_9GLOM|nr:2616_t:CDS:10 [Funneliformis geosporum]CAI2187457.1 4599_t:CDS:10 [Funneliformis geosporum]
MDPRSKQFENIYYGLSNTPGILKLAPSGLGWKTSDAENIVTISAEEFKKMQWMRVARNYQLRIALKNGNAARFDGFNKDMFDAVKELVRANYKLPLETKELSVKGWNWGKTEFQGSQLLFNIGSKTAFEIPLIQVANSNLANRNEVNVEFMQPDQTGEPQGKSKKAPMHELVEMRFYIPGTTIIKDDNEKEEEEMSAASLFYETVKDKADLGQASGEGLALFQDILLLTPRGRYDIEVFPTFFRLRGKTYDYKIQMKSVVNLFLLPKLDEVHELFVIGLDPPLRQGQTLYHFLVLQFKQDDEIDLALNIDEDDLKRDYGERLLPRYECPIHEAVSLVFQGLTKKKINRPSTYRNKHDEVAVKASLKANEGYLYPLEKCFLFVPKPPTYLPFSEIMSVTFSRVSANLTKKSDLGGPRTFDMKFNMKSGVEFGFSSLNREEYEDLEVYLRSKNIKTIKDTADESESVDPEDEDSEMDEDFIASSEDSDVAEEYDENYSGSDSSSDGTSKKKGEKDKKTSKPKAK